MPYVSDPETPPSGGFGWLIHLLWVIAVIAILVWVIRLFLH
jgi:hypothetical protein